MIYAMNLATPISSKPCSVRSGFFHDVIDYGANSGVDTSMSFLSFGVPAVVDIERIAGNEAGVVGG